MCEWAREAASSSSLILASSGASGDFTAGGEDLQAEAATAEARLRVARVLSGAGQELSQPRARY